MNQIANTSYKNILPDFGFNCNNHNEKEAKGNWNIITEHITGQFKYERLENYIEARNIVTTEIKELRKK